jgi:hypothetical protein
VKTQRQDSQPTPENMTATDEHEMTNVEVNNKAKVCNTVRKHKFDKRGISSIQ